MSKNRNKYGISVNVLKNSGRVDQQTNNSEVELALYVPSEMVSLSLPRDR